MRILGIDPGYAIVGFGALDYVRGAFCPVQYGAITTQAHTLFEQRLEEIYFDMTQLLQNLKPDAVFSTTRQRPWPWRRRAACCCYVRSLHACRCSNTHPCR